MNEPEPHLEARVLALAGEGSIKESAAMLRLDDRLSLPLGGWRID
ncbi:MAG: hypothetical protein WAN93_11695 [Solirubrobacteraceae bacterium]